MKRQKINKRSNAYRAGQACTRKKHFSLSDNPYRIGTQQWHEWRAGFEDAIKIFVAGVINSINNLS